MKGASPRYAVTSPQMEHGGSPMNVKLIPERSIAELDDLAALRRRRHRAQAPASPTRRPPRPSPLCPQPAALTRSRSVSSTVPAGAPTRRSFAHIRMAPASACIELDPDDPDQQRLLICISPISFVSRISFLWHDRPKEISHASHSHRSDHRP